MPSKFEEKKAKILTQLSVPDEAYSDLSPKGSVDRGVRELCADINALEGFVTTSSCAGRVAVYLEGGGQQKALPDDEVGDASMAAGGSGGGKGGGEWLYVSHDPLDISHVGDATSGGLMSLFGMDSKAKPSTPSSLTGIRFVHFRFEPMILHILTSSLQNAQTAHSAGLVAGFRESGISSISGTDSTPIVAIRTQGLFLSSIVGCQESEGLPGSHSLIKPMVTEEYLKSLVQLANRRFLANEERKERFRRALLKPGKDASNAFSTWEPAEERSKRLRAEGLRRRDEMRQRRAMAAAEDEEPGSTMEDQVGGEDEDYHAVGLGPEHVNY